MDKVTKSKFLNGLNENQAQAVLATEGYVRIIAGAGSGKTKVLVNRYAYIVEELGISPSNILCVTFTNRAAKEMLSRVQRLVSQGNINDLICTYHGFCVKVLREDCNKINYPESFTILDSEDQKDILREVYDELSINSTDITHKEALKHIRFFKNTAQYITKFIIPSVSIPKNSQEDIKTQITIGYLKIQQKNFALDFDDLINLAFYIFKSFPEVLEKWQERLHYIMVDETQDNSANQWELVSMLSKIHKNLFVVGDPDQAIYGWRGASPLHLVHFDTNFQPCKTLILNENYRSTPNILDVANSIIVNNTDRIEKDLVTKGQIGAIVTHFHGKTDQEEGLWVAKTIKQRQIGGASFSNFAILFRASHVSRVLEQSLIKESIPYVVWGGVRFFERAEIKDSLAYLRMISVGDDISFLRIVNNPSRKLGKKFLQNLKKSAEEENLSLYETLKKYIDQREFNKPGAKNFIELIDNCCKKVNSISISDLLQYILETSGLLELIRLDGDQERIDNVEELMTSIRIYEKENSNEEKAGLSKYLQDIALYTNLDRKTDNDFVKLMTIHQSKGLEFKFVFVCGLSEGILPSYRALRERKKEALEEERRLAYVAITRAMVELFLTESEGFSHETSDKYPSRFIYEIKKELVVLEGVISSEIESGAKYAIIKIDEEIFGVPINLALGDMVAHQVFGIGKVIEVDTNQMVNTIKFDDQEDAKPISFNFKGLSKIEEVSDVV
ncbi:MAG: UvrD-helicase domain-containing protein [Bacteroidota bacterium]